MLTKLIKERIKIHAQRESPKECCGFIIFNHDGLLESIEVKNGHEDPYHNVLVNPKDYLNVDFLGEIKAFYHSHLGREKLSEVDKQASLFNEIPYVVYCLEKDSFETFIPKEANKYVGRDFEWNKTDCFNLIIDYYWNEFRIKINNYLPDRTEGWWKTSGNLVEKYKDLNGFYEVPEPEDYDIIILELNRNQFHFGIYIDGQILHHPRGKKSLMQEYGDKMINKTRYILRNRNLKLK